MAGIGTAPIETPWQHAGHTNKRLFVQADVSKLQRPAAVTSPPDRI